MKKSDVIVIGAGLAGLTAASAAAKDGHSVTLLTKGVGTLAFGGGVIDILGYAQQRRLQSPREIFAALPKEHPYAISGQAAVEQGVEYIRNLCAAANYPLDGSLDENILIPTAAGTLKPSCLVPKTMNAADMPAAKAITVIGFEGLKDFYPAMVIMGLKGHKGYGEKQFSSLMVRTDLAQGRDITNLDIARWLDQEAAQASLVQQISATVAPGSYILMPPVLGTEPSYDLWQKVEAATGCRVVEVAAPPPAITGSRLRTLLMRTIKEQGIRLIEHTHVRRAEYQGKRCSAVITQHLDRERRYEAGAFILAAGGFLGGGLDATPEGFYEPIFNLPVTSDGLACAPSGSLFDSNEVFRAGIRVDALLRPCDAKGDVLYENLHVAGKMLAGYDYSVEKSGNGVAVVSGFQAAQAAVRSGKND